MNSRRSRLIVAGLALAMGLYCFFHLRIETRLLRFLPDGSNSELADISARVADSDLTRTVALSIRAGDPAHARAAAREMAEMLRGRPEVAWVRTGLEAQQLEELYALYFPRRFYLLSDAPERELPARFSDAALRARARALRQELALPTSTLMEEIAGADPVGAFAEILLRFRGEESTRMEEGQFVSTDGLHAIVLLATRASAFDSTPQGQLLDAIEQRFEALRSEAGEDLELEQSGAGRFAVISERSIKRDIYWIAGCSSLGLTAIFLLLVGGVWRFVLVALPPLAGVAVATTTGLVAWGALEGLTMAFGCSLMGVAIDYSVHVLVHHGLARSTESPFDTARRLRPSLALGAATTVASFAGLALTAIPAFREMSFFAMLGLTAALAAALYVLPGLMPEAQATTRRAERGAQFLGRALSRLAPRRVALLALPLALLIVAPFALPRLLWVDDLARLSDLDPALFEEDRRVRARISRFDASRFVVGSATSPEEAVALNDEIHAALSPLVESGALAGTRSLHALLWSESLQRRNLDWLRAQPDLPARVDAAFAAEGFRPGAFADFARELANPPPPLRLAELQESAFANLISPWIFSLATRDSERSGDENEAEGRTAVVTYLRGVESEASVREAVAELPGVYLFDNRSFVNQIYGEFRRTTLQQMALGSVLVFGLLLARYRRLRPTLAAFLPSALVALSLLEIFALVGVETNFLHVMALVMVLGMGVDYGIFVVDSAGHPEHLGATLLSLLVSCLTTLFVFGTLAISSHPALRAIGMTTGLGILLSLLYAPLSLLLIAPKQLPKT